MKIYHLNCGSMTAKYPRVDAITYCLLVESNQGLILVDTGMGRQDYENPNRLMKIFMFWVGVHQNMAETAYHQITTLGYRPEDIKHIVLTHMHLDHAGGLSDFPQAKVHLHAIEYNAALHPKSLLERAYLPYQWDHNPQWVCHHEKTEDWFGLEGISILEGLEPKILLIPLPGHTRGHCGVAIQTATGWLLHCGDAASPLHPASDLHQRPENDFPGKSLPGGFVHYLLGDHVPQLRNLLKQHGDQVEIISAHDIFSFNYYRRQSLLGN